MYTGRNYHFLTNIEHQAFHEGLKASPQSYNPYNGKYSPHQFRAWSKGNLLAFRLNARLGVQYLNAL